MTEEKLYSLHEQVKWAKANGGKVAIDADDLLDLLPPSPTVVESAASEPAVGDNHQPIELKPAESTPAPKPAA